MNNSCYTTYINLMGGRYRDDGRLGSNIYIQHSIGSEPHGKLETKGVIIVKVDKNSEPIKKEKSNHCFPFRYLLGSFDFNGVFLGIIIRNTDDSVMACKSIQEKIAAMTHRTCRVDVTNRDMPIRLSELTSKLRAKPASKISTVVAARDPSVT